MATGRNYVESLVLAQLAKKPSVRIQGKQIQELNGGKGDVGNGSRGKITFLVRYCGYQHKFVESFKN